MRYVSVSAYQYNSAKPITTTTLSKITNSPAFTPPSLLQGIQETTETPSTQSFWPIRPETRVKQTTKILNFSDCEEGWQAMQWWIWNNSNVCHCTIFTHTTAKTTFSISNHTALYKVSFFKLPLECHHFSLMGLDINKEKLTKKTKKSTLLPPHSLLAITLSLCVIFLSCEEETTLLKNQWYMCSKPVLVQEEQLDCFFKSDVQP